MTAPPWRVTVRLFASFAELAGWREQALEVPSGTTVAGLVELLRQGDLAALPGGARPLLAVDRQHVPPETVLRDGCEVGIFPPVSGGAPDEPVAVVTDEPLAAKELADAVRDPSRGAIVTFEGAVRDFNAGSSVTAIEYEAYADMAREVLVTIDREVRERYPTARLAMAHRTGRLTPGDVSVVVACGAPHRREAFAACRLAMDRIKESLPIWKREETADVGPRWL